jgi:hypothetical protein
VAVTLPSLLTGRNGTQHGQQVAFKLADGSQLGGNSGYPRLVGRATVTELASRHITTITTGPERVDPSEHFVSAGQPAVRAQTTTVQAQTTTAQAQISTVQAQATPPAAQPRSDAHQSTAAGQTYLAATRSSPKHASTRKPQRVTETTLARAQSSAHHPAALGDGGAGVRAAKRPASQPQNDPPHSSSGNSRSGSASHSSSSSHSSSGPSHAAVKSGGAAIHRPPSSGSSHRSGPGPGGYANPLAQASVTPERIDQGVDYAGSGPLDALGDGVVTYVGTTGTGWPGAFIEFRLSNGPDAGRYVYYAESVRPVRGLHVGEQVSAGQQIATIYNGSSGIEIGWGAGVGTESYAMQHGQWSSSADSNNVATPAGKNFSNLIASLGGPPGKNEG